MARAKGNETSAAQLAMDLLMQDGGEGMLYFPLFNYSESSLDVLHLLHQSDDVLMGLSDAGAHCGAICDGGMPTFMLTHWSRDRATPLSLPHIVARQTRDTAKQFGLVDRGLLRPGMRADVNVIDYDNLALDRPKMKWDLPAGGRRLTQRAKGYVATICAGELIVEHDELTDARPGGLVRRGSVQVP